MSIEPKYFFKEHIHIGEDIEKRKPLCKLVQPLNGNGDDCSIN